MNISALLNPVNTSIIRSSLEGNAPAPNLNSKGNKFIIGNPQLDNNSNNTFVTSNSNFFNNNSVGNNDQGANF